MTQYSGGCQCGAVRYSVDIELDGAATCNCSRCQRLGSRLAFAPAAKFTLEQGQGAQTQYTFNRQVIRHQFCTTCGIESFAYGKAPDGSDVVAVNINTIDGIDPQTVKTRHFDGRAL